MQKIFIGLLHLVIKNKNLKIDAKKLMKKLIAMAFKLGLFSGLCINKKYLKINIK